MVMENVTGWPLESTVAGEPYVVMVGAANGGAGGLLRFVVCRPTDPVPPRNDTVSGATVITSLPATFTEDVSGATNYSDDRPFCGTWWSVWFSYTPTVDEHVFFDTMGSDYDTELAVSWIWPVSRWTAMKTRSAPFSRVWSSTSRPAAPTSFRSAANTGSVRRRPARWSQRRPDHPIHAGRGGRSDCAGGSLRRGSRDGDGDLLAARRGGCAGRAHPAAGQSHRPRLRQRVGDVRRNGPLTQQQGNRTAHGSGSESVTCDGTGRFQALVYRDPDSRFVAGRADFAVTAQGTSLDVYTETTATGTVRLRR
jgi:hypothetical protein